MVMDATPSPQCVGREFVRQYYTLLHEAPQYLHRFYSNNSSFIHGGDGESGMDNQPAIIGQNEIRKKIMSLNFTDCRAKIRYVDSQTTIGTGVVVQVTGELSNAGEPLRRFMQTFVLAPQTPNKYYVHNDIFRYQDEVFDESEEEEELTEQNASAVKQEDEKPEQQPPKQYSGDLDRSGLSPHPPEPDMVKRVATTPPPNAQDEDLVKKVPASPEHKMTNGHSTSLKSSPESVDKRPSASPPEQPQLDVENRPEAEPDTEDHEDKTTQGGEPSSWASFFSKGTPGASSSTGTTPQVQTVQPRVADSTKQSATASGNTTEQQQSFSQQDQQQNSSRAQVRGNRPGSSFPPKGYGGDSRPNRNTELQHQSSFPGSREERPQAERVKYPDNQQVFVGNLPQQVSQFELKDLFKRFGTVLEVRVNRNPMQKGPLFGFVVFDNEESVRDALETKTIDLKGQPLNIEEKKPRQDQRSMNPGGRPGRRDGGGPRHMRGGQSGGGGRFGGPPRDDSGSRMDQQGRYNNKPYQQPQQQQRH